MQKYLVPQAPLTTPEKLAISVGFLKRVASAEPVGRLVGPVYYGYVCESPRPLTPMERRITGAYPLPKAAAA